MLLLGQFIGGGTLASVLEYSAKINISSALALFLVVVLEGGVLCLHGACMVQGSLGSEETGVRAAAGVTLLSLHLQAFAPWPQAAGIVLWVPAVSLTVFERSFSLQRESQDHLLEWLWGRKGWDRMSRHMGWEVVHGCVGVCNTAISFQGLPL